MDIVASPGMRRLTLFTSSNTIVFVKWPLNREREEGTAHIKWLSRGEGVG